MSFGKPGVRLLSGGDVLVVRRLPFFFTSTHFLFRFSGFVFFFPDKRTAQ